MKKIGTIAVVILVGIPGHIIICLLMALRLIRVPRYWQLWRQVREGNVVILANHPSLAETGILPLLLAPFALWKIRFFLWSAPDEKLFPGYLSWLHRWGRCIRVARGDNSRNRESLTNMVEVLKQGGALILHGEMGRTGSPCRKTGEKPKLTTRGRRKLRPLTPGIALLARRAGAKVMPLYIEFSPEIESDGFLGVFWQMLTRWAPVTFHVGDLIADAKSKRPEDMARYLLAA